MKKQLLFVLLALFCVGVQAQEKDYLEIPLSELKKGGRLFLSYKKNQQKTKRGERYADFVRKFEAPTEQKEYKNECMFDEPMVRAKYGKNSFLFCKETVYFQSKVVAEEGLKEYELYDRMFVLYDKERNVSIGVGDGEEQLRKFVPSYKSGQGSTFISFKGKDYKGQNFESSFQIIIDVEKGKVSLIVARDTAEEGC